MDNPSRDRPLRVYTRQRGERPDDAPSLLAHARAKRGKRQSSAKVPQSCSLCVQRKSDAKEPYHLSGHSSGRKVLAYLAAEFVGTDETPCGPMDWYCIKVGQSIERVRFALDANGLRNATLHWSKGSVLPIAGSGPEAPKRCSANARKRTLHRELEMRGDWSRIDLLSFVFVGKLPSLPTWSLEQRLACFASTLGITLPSTWQEARAEWIAALVSWEAGKDSFLSTIAWWIEQELNHASDTGQYDAYAIWFSRKDRLKAWIEGTNPDIALVCRFNTAEKLVDPAPRKGGNSYGDGKPFDRPLPQHQIEAATSPIA